MFYPLFGERHSLHFFSLCIAIIFILKVCQLYPHNICMKYFILLRYFLEKHALKCFERAQKQSMAKGGENICNFIAWRFKIQNSQYKNKYFSSWRGRKYFLVIFHTDNLSLIRKWRNHFPSCAFQHYVARAGSCLLSLHSDTAEEQLSELEATASWLKMTVFSYRFRPNRRTPQSPEILSPVLPASTKAGVCCWWACFKWSIPQVMLIKGAQGRWRSKAYCWWWSAKG